MRHSNVAFSSLLFIFTNFSYLVSNQRATDALENAILEHSIMIKNTPTSDYTTLAELYSSRGEDYLIFGLDSNAFNDFTKAYEYGVLCTDKNESTAAVFRSFPSWD